MQLAALTPKHHSIFALDNPTTIDYSLDVNIVAITATTPSIIDAYQIADNFRKRNVIVVIGGWHASALPTEAKLHADSVFIGEAEDTWPRFLKDFENGRFEPFYKQNNLVSAESITTPRRDVFEQLAPIAPLQAIWGCPNNCEFCCISNIGFGNKPRFRPIESIIEEIRSIPQKYLFFCDPSLTINPDYTKNLFRKLKEFDKTLLMCNGNADVLAKDDELLKLSSEAGCLEWLIGFESISQETIDSIGKKTNIVKEYSTAVKKIHDNNMEVIGEFVFGFDKDKPDIFEKTYESIKSMEIDLPAPGILTPYPGTPLYNRFEKEGRILTKDWSRYTERNVVFQPKNMTKEELLEGTKDIKERIFRLSFRTYKKRRIDKFSNNF